MRNDVRVVMRPQRGRSRSNDVLVAGDAAATARLEAAAADAGLIVVASTPDAGAALDLAASLHPSLCVLELSPPAIAQAVLEEILDVAPTIKVIVIAADDEPDACLDAMCAGAVGYLANETEHAGLITALRDVQAGQAAVSTSLLPVVVSEIRRC